MMTTHTGPPTANTQAAQRGNNIETGTTKSTIGAD
jgi:hypothetical protein